MVFVVVGVFVVVLFGQQPSVFTPKVEKAGGVGSILKHALLYTRVQMKCY